MGVCHVRGYISTNYMNHSCARVRDRGGGRLLVLQRRGEVTC